MKKEAKSQEHGDEPLELAVMGAAPLPLLLRNHETGLENSKSWKENL